MFQAMILREWINSRQIIQIQICCVPRAAVSGGSKIKSPRPALDYSVSAESQNVSS